MTQRQSRRTALVTGASAGIGKAFAERLAADGYDLVLTARRGDRLRDLARALAERHGVTARVVVADLADPEAPGRIFRDVSGAGIAVDLLVNNAGYGQPGDFADLPWDKHRAFIQVMVTAPAELTHRFLPGMIARHHGRIVNVASVAGMLPSPAGHTLYGASKAFLIRFSQALALECRPHGVHVTALCPGYTYSEFHDVTGTRERVNRLPRWAWLTAEEVARQGYEAVMAGRAVVVNGWRYRALTSLIRLVPEGWLHALMSRVAIRNRGT